MDLNDPLREWAYARSYDSSEQRTAHLPGWLQAACQSRL